MDYLKSFKKYIITLLFLVILFGVSTPLYAQQLSLAIDPPQVRMFIQPGKTVTIPFELQNSADPAIIKGSIISFKPKDSKGNITLDKNIQGPVRFSIQDTQIELDRSFLLKTNDKRQILLTMRASDGAPEGDYYYSFTFKTDAQPNTEGGSSVRSSTTIASNILITVTSKGNLDINGKTNLFNIIPTFNLNLFGKRYKLVDSLDQIPVVLIVSNQGKNMFTAKGSVVLKGFLGQATYTIIPQYILSQSQRILLIEQFSKPDCKESKQSKICSNEISGYFSGFFIGKYTLIGTIDIGNSQPMRVSTTFVAFPIKLLSGLLLSIVISLGLMAILKTKHIVVKE